MKKSKAILSTMAVLAAAVSPLLNTGAVLAAGGTCPPGSLKDTYINSPSECNVSGSNTFATDLQNIINWIVGVAGLVAVVVVIIGGITYMTSNGDPGKVKKGKDTILYGVIGLLICALAFAIVNFVISGLWG